MNKLLIIFLCSLFIIPVQSMNKPNSNRAHADQEYQVLYIDLACENKECRQISTIVYSLARPIRSWTCRHCGHVNGIDEDMGLYIRVDQWRKAQENQGAVKK